ncbi:MAG: hypothetical protein A2579_02865 [Lysobacterales bacterium RIFOXYD1_FULL_69_11]|nr:MAG: hypothetical protein A2190_07855 [Xanthomonadales bacterium RIFOXYA1_FULL_69_10]OHE87632.1 MAG: hypothetical protein A2579_02865 [Xanthomonadales bacterium RIFOXYD1_FULL_69_11]
MSLVLLLATASTACAPDSMTDAASATRPSAPTVDSVATVNAPAEQGRPVSSSADDARSCDVARVDALAGHAATPSNLDLARELSGAASVRVIGPGEPVTEDYSASRLNLEVDGDDVILRAACG